MKLLTELDSLDNVKDGETRKLVTKTSTSGNGNVVSSVGISGDTITYTKGVTALTAHQNAFSNVKVGSTTVAADSAGDTLELVAGSNVTLTPDATNDKVTIAATDTTYTDGTAGYVLKAKQDKDGNDITTTYYLASNPNGYTTNTGTITKVQANGTDVASSGTANIPAATTSKYGVTELSSATNSTSEALAATPKAVKAAYDLAASKGTGTITGVSVNGTSVATSGVANITSMPASILTGAIPSAVTATTQTAGDSSTKVATTAFVSTAISALPAALNNIKDGSQTGSIRTSGSAEESSSYTIGQKAFSEGSNTKASGTASHAEGASTTASGSSAHAEGCLTAASSDYTHAEGNNTTASASYAHAEGHSTTASGNSAHAEGTSTVASASYAHTEGYDTKASDTAAHAEGYGTKATEDETHAEGYYTKATDLYSHAEGAYTATTGAAAHAEGYYRSFGSGTIGTVDSANLQLTVSGLPNYYGNYLKCLLSDKSYVTSDYSIESSSRNSSSGVYTFTVSKWNSGFTAGAAIYVFGVNRANGTGAHAEGQGTLAYSDGSHSEGIGTIAYEQAQHAEGKWNVASSTYAHVVGNGTAHDARSNAYSLDWNGNGTYAGKLTVGTGPSNNMDVATKKYVDDSILALPEPMIFKGSLGTGGTITTLPTASASNEGYTYKVITAGTYASQSAKVGDAFISDGSTWVLIPSGDEPSGTVTSIKIEATGPIAVNDSSAITTSGTRTISHANSGVTAGTYRSVTVNATGHVTAGTNPTTLSGYGITDAKIASGVITLGSNTITPLTASSTLDATKVSGTLPTSTYTDTKNTAGSTNTSSKIYLIGATSQAANPQTYSDNEVYATSGVLTTKSVQVGGTAATMQYNSTDKCIEFVFA